MPAQSTPRKRARSTAQPDENVTPTKCTLRPRNTTNNDLKNIEPANHKCAPVTPDKPSVLSQTVLQMTAQAKSDSQMVSSPIKTPLSMARTAFRRSSTPRKLVGREPERKRLREFWERCVGAGVSGALYVSGCPGTGKSALVEEVVESFKREERFKDVKVVKVNCMALPDPKAIFAHILGVIDGRSAGKNAADVLEEIVMKPSSSSIVIVLDEMDQLVDRNHEVLYQLFGLSKKDGSKLVMIGIANALDMTERLLPCLKYHLWEPELLMFRPYAVKEIAEIIRDRLRSIGEDEDEDTENDRSPTKRRKCASAPVTPVASTTLMQDAAVEFCARKVGGTGDVRKALDICRFAFEILEDEATKKKQFTKEVGNVKNSELFVDEVTPMVTIKHILQATASALGNTSSISKIRELNIQQRIILCLVALMHRDNRDLSISKVYDTYAAFCRVRKQVTPVTRSELSDLIAMLETTGLLSVGTTGVDKRKRKAAEGRIALGVVVDEVLEGVASSSLLKRMVDEGIADLKV